MKICFLDKTNFTYSIEDVYNPKLRGAETILINLAKQFSNFGNEVFVYNNCSKTFKKNNLYWNSIEALNPKNGPLFDIVFCNNDCRLLNKVNAKKKYVF